MSLYVRVRTSFFSSRKTLRLRVLLGNDAYWIPVRLWAYAADNQADGNFAGYIPEELASALGYTGDANAMLEALLQAGFLDEGLQIHDWDEHNGYHASYHERAKKAAAARWKTPPPTPPCTDKNRRETSIACSMLQAFSSLNTEAFVVAWTEYEQYRRERRLSVLKASSVKRQFKEMDQWGEPKAITAIQETIKNGWQGIFEPKQANGSTSKPRNRSSVARSHDPTGAASAQYSGM